MLLKTDGIVYTVKNLLIDVCEKGVENKIWIGQLQNNGLEPFSKF